MHRVVIFDLDGTLCDDRKRQDLARARKWDEYHAAHPHDPPRLAELIMARALGEMGIWLVIITGRTEPYRQTTQHWLWQNGLDRYVFQLHMRGATDRRPATQVKLEVYNELVEEGHTILFVVEDNTALVNMWRGLGLTCFQCQGEHPSDGL